MSNEDYKPRFVFEITETQQRRCDKVFGQFGLRKALFQPILDDVLNGLETHGDRFAAAIVSGLVKPREIIPALNRATKISEELSNG